MRQKWCHSETEAGPGMAPGGKREVQKKSCKKCWKIGIGDDTGIVLLHYGFEEKDLLVCVGCVEVFAFT